MKVIVDTVLSGNESSGYFDDIHVDKSIISADHVKKHLAKVRLTWKDPKWFWNGAHVWASKLRENKTPLFVSIKMTFLDFLRS